MNKWSVVLIVLVIIYAASNIAANIIGKGTFEDKIVIIPIKGVITVDGGDSGFYSISGASSDTILKQIEEVSKDKTVKGAIFEINSPGGAVVASQEIADAVKALNKTKYAVIREVGASGAYWVASATDKIIASPMSITGSIGVISSYLEFSKLFEKYGVDYERLVSGERKDIGVPYRDLTDEERKLLQKKLALVHEYFIKEVAKNRKMNEDEVRKVATGEFYLGQEALDLRLVDELGNEEKAVELMKQELGIKDINVVKREERKGILELLQGISYNIGQGFGSVFKKEGIKIEAI
ncbi:MAG TPA: signal peptide peptidase SppA [Candidatus Nanoarchaeia archaeon]|nr:signal peptide peptidase SppA [Candidatus Nanoarchaeia archaeon]